VLAKQGTFPQDLMTLEFLTLADWEGHTVAHELAKWNVFPKRVLTPELLSLSDRNGWTVAHLLAGQGNLPRELMTPNMLTFANSSGWTVAHELAARDVLPLDLMTPEILALEVTHKTLKGLLIRTVAQVLQENSEKYDPDELAARLEEYESYRKGRQQSVKDR
jgi:hypothetical protein